MLLYNLTIAVFESCPFNHVGHAHTEPDSHLFARN